jgi:5'/3'-nucleotidase SurE
MRLFFRFLFIGLTLILNSAVEAQDSSPLKILLTNDDGFDAFGIRALRSALMEAGHDVTLVAPDRNYSGTSAMLTAPFVKLEEHKDKVFSVTGSPAACTLFGLTAVFSIEEPPDLVISGINHGPNVGPTTSFSGTVGAATMAMSMGVPAIAFSTETVGVSASHPRFVEHFREVADFAARLVGQLVSSKGEGQLLAAGSGLNVNYPALPKELVAGVVVASQGRFLERGLVFKEKDSGNYQIAYRLEEEKDPEGTDTIAFDKGYVTIVPIDNDRTSNGEALSQAKARFGSLRP